MSRVSGCGRLKNPHCSTAQWSWVTSICQNLQPFTGNGDVTIWKKNSRVEWKPNQTNILVNPRHCSFKGNSNIQKIILIHWQSYRVGCTFMNKGDQPINIGPLIQGWSSLHVLIFAFCIPLHILCIQTYWKKICSLYHRLSVKIMHQIYSFIYYLYMIFIHKN